MSILDDHTRYDPAAMPNPIGGASTGATDSASKPGSSGPSKKDIRDLAASFEPVKPEAPTPAEKERKRRLDMWAKNVEVLAKELLGHQAADGDVQATHKALTALKTVANQGAKAIGSLKDGQLLPAEPKAPRTAKPAVAGTQSDHSGGGYVQSGGATVDSTAISDTAPTSIPGSDDADSNTGF